MKVYGGLMGGLKDVPARVKELEEVGYDAAVTAETAHDPFFPLVLAAEHSSRIGLATSIAVAFARNPMLLAGIGHDLNSCSGGRFTLGLGSQIAPHITRRFSMPWSKPAARMREFILAMRAIWECWYQGKPLEFRGEFYTHSLMTPMFTPTDTEHGPPRVLLAAVGPLMTEVAAEVADGLIAHGFTTERYLREVTLPAVARGLERAGRDRRDFEILVPAFVVTGDSAEARENADAGVRRQIAFYGSTPAYRPVLELHGWGELQDELHRMSKQGRWAEMGTRISDEVLDAFALVTSPEELPERMQQRFGGLVDSWMCTVDRGDPDAQRELVRALRG